MNKKLLRDHVSRYRQYIESNQVQHEVDSIDRRDRALYYQGFTDVKITGMSEEVFAEFISKLWAMRVWGNKQYVITKLIEDNGFKKIKRALAALVWGEDKIALRWDLFREAVKGVGPAMMSEILCHVHPTENMLWNRRAYAGFNHLEVPNLPKYNYQLTGAKYDQLSGVAREIASELENSGFKNADLLTVDYFIWHELQIETPIVGKEEAQDPPIFSDVAQNGDNKTSKFVHNEIRDKLAEIGRWLGFDGRTEVKVSDGSKVDAIWEATIGNMGRVIYVFEVQTKGNTDSLMVNLFKSLKNQAVQGVVAVSDPIQIEKIKKHSADMPGLAEKLKCWNYEEVLRVHEALESVNESINGLGLVPIGF